MWEPRRLTTLWTSTACYRDSFTFFLGKGRVSLASSEVTPLDFARGKKALALFLESRQIGKVRHVARMREYTKFLSEYLEEDILGGT
jgi:hypothetical protein